jgi:hypothetical protein
MNHRVSQPILLIGILAALGLFSAEAAQIAPNPNPVGNDIVVAGGESDSNGLAFTNNGNIVLMHGTTVLAGGELSNLAGATLTNNGVINAESWNVSQGIYRNYGLTENYGSVGGDIRNEVGGTFINYASGTGGVNNSGLLTNHGTFTGSNSGTVDNYGVFRNLSNYSGGVFNNDSSAVLRAGDSSLAWPYNFGSISTAGTINNDGSIIIDSDSGLLVNGAYASGGSAPTDGVIHNDGSITSGGSGSYVVIQAGGSIDGTGTFTQTDGVTYLESASAEGSIVQSEIRIEGGALTGVGRLQSTSAPLFIGAGATVAPGFSPGTLSVTGDLDLEGTYQAEIDGLGMHDVIDVTGSVSLGSGSTLDVIFSFAPVVSDVFDLLLGDEITGSFGFVNVTFPAPPPVECGSEEECGEGFSPYALYTSGGYGYDLSVIQDAIGTIDVLRLTITSVPAVVPVPAAFWLFGSALAGLGVLRRRDALAIRD